MKFHGSCFQCALHMASMDLVRFVDNRMIGPPYLSESTISRLSHNWRALLVRLILDLILGILIIAPLLISFWRSNWYLLTIILQNFFGNGQSNCIYDNTRAILVGIIGTQFWQSGQFWIKRYIAGASNSWTLRFIITSRFYSIILGVIDIQMWRGVWELLDCATVEIVSSKNLSVFTLAVGLIGLLLTKKLKTAVSVPIAIRLETYGECCKTDTFLETKETDSIFMKIFDSFITTLISICVIFLWHGIWNLLDIYFHQITPNISLQRSAWISIAMSNIFGAILFLAQFPLNRLCKNDDFCNLSKIFLSSLFNFVGALCSINMFRGVWYLLDELYLPEHRLSSLIHGAIIGSMGLCLIGCGPIMSSGLSKDFINSQSDILLQNHYFTYIYIQEKSHSMLKQDQCSPIIRQNSQNSE